MSTTPMAIEDLSYERILEEKLQSFTVSYQAVVPGYPRPIPADPAYRVLAELSFSELVLRARINAAALSALLKYSQDLDFLFSGRRREGEDIEAFRERMRLDIQSASPAGPLETYASLSLSVANQGKGSREEFPCLAAKAEVEGDIIKIWLQPNPIAPEDPESILQRVIAYWSEDWTKPAFDLVEVAMATPKPVDIRATVRLAGRYGEAFMESLKESFQKTWAEESRLAWAVSPAWIISKLKMPEVFSVELSSPQGNLEASASEYLVIRSLDLEVAER